MCSSDLEKPIGGVLIRDVPVGVIERAADIVERVPDFLGGRFRNGASFDGWHDDVGLFVEGVVIFFDALALGGEIPEPLIEGHGVQVEGGRQLPVGIDQRGEARLHRDERRVRRALLLQQRGDSLDLRAALDGIETLLVVLDEDLPRHHEFVVGLAQVAAQHVLILDRKSTRLNSSH